MVRIRWEKHFRDSSSFYFGLQFSESKIVVKKAAKIFKRFYFIYLISFLLPVIFLKQITIKVEKNTAEIINNFLVFTTVLGIIYMIFIIINTIQSRVKSTYRFILKTQYIGLLFLVLIAFNGGVFSDKGEMNPIFTGFSCGGFTLVFIYHYFYKKHKDAITKYKIS